MAATGNPYSPLELAGRNVHIWSIRTEAPDAVNAAYEAVLSPDERARAARFQSSQLVHAFILSRGALRILLSRYLGVHPASVQFKYGSNGKPRIAAQTSLEFNVSHSGGLTLLAFTHDCSVGIDVEQIRSLPDLQDIAQRFFCVEESTELAKLVDPLQRERAFFLCWTRKEAYIKAVGLGLSARLDRFRVNLDPSEPARFVRLPSPGTEAWTLTNLSFDPAYAAALAYRDEPRRVTASQILNPADLLA